MEFNGARLYGKRLAADMSRADLAAAVRVKSSGRIKASEAGIRGWEKDKHSPGGEAVVALAAALDCRVEELYGELDSDDAEAAMPAVPAHLRDDYALFGALALRLISKARSETGAARVSLIGWLAAASLLIGAHA